MIKNLTALLLLFGLVVLGVLAVVTASVVGVEYYQWLCGKTGC